MSTSKEINIGKQIFTINYTPSKEEMARIHNAVENDKRIQTHGEYDQPGIEISLVLKDSHGNVRGGVNASTVFRVMHLEVLWVAEEDRRQGYGAQLVLAAEKIGLANGCLTSQTWTFSFQGPEFYPTLGYQPIGTYVGYPNGITEHAFMKPLSSNPHDPKDHGRELGIPDSRGLYLTTDVSDEDLKILHAGLHRHVKAHVGDDDQGISIKLVIMDQNGKLVGGLLAWTTLHNLIFEHLWIEEEYRRKGLGQTLMLEMERIAQENGCIASQAYCFSFQAYGFFEKMGYKILGVSNGYPPPIQEYYLIKKYNQSPGW